MSISSIKKALRNVFQGKLKNIVSLADDSPVDNHLKPLKIGDKTTNIELSEDDLDKIIKAIKNDELEKDRAISILQRAKTFLQEGAKMMKESKLYMQPRYVYYQASW